MKLYTKRGDDGGTDLFGGARVGKDSPRIAAIGTVDELNAAVGLAASACRGEELSVMLALLQNRLFDLGADLATPRRGGDEGKPGVIRRVAPVDIDEAERMIDALCEPVPPLRAFVLPGGGELAARLHVARGVCRRAERECVALARLE